jgi:hypothetical protein
VSGQEAGVLRIGFIGTGNISRRHFAALAKLRDEAEVVAVCDLLEERASAAAGPLGRERRARAPDAPAGEQLGAMRWDISQITLAGGTLTDRIGWMEAPTAVLPLAAADRGDRTCKEQPRDETDTGRRAGG